MSFSSIEFLLFFTATVIIYYLIPNKYRYLILIASSSIFIGWISVPFLFFTYLFVIVNYIFGALIDKQQNKKTRRIFYLIGIILDIGLLAFFKYINFIFENVNYLIRILIDREPIPVLSLIIPVGISFYTFQAIGYLIRVYRTNDKAEKHFGYFLSYLLFFPKFLSGPVERANHFLPQILNEKSFNQKNVISGIQLMLWGFFKKVIIADSLGIIVTNIYGNLHDYTGIPLLAGMFIQTIHLYCDFSGYTDIALGTSNILGFNIIDNFERPLFAVNVSDLWRRWHISLSTWCNDFIFKTIILKRRKWGIWASTYGVFMTFLVIGIWHGASWNYVFLGILQGAAINYEYFSKRKRLAIGEKIPVRLNKLISRIFTFIFFSFSLIFFNSPTFNDASYFISNLFTNIGGSMQNVDFGLKRIDLIIVIMSFLLLYIVEYFQENKVNVKEIFINKPRWTRYILYYILILLLFYFSKNQETFVYIQF